MNDLRAPSERTFEGRCTFHSEFRQRIIVKKRCYIRTLVAHYNKTLLEVKNDEQTMFWGVDTIDSDDPFLSEMVSLILPKRACPSTALRVNNSRK